MNLQEKMLEELKTKQIPATFFMMNGFQLRGILIAYDGSVLVVVTDGKQQIIYKHAVSTIVPMRSLNACKPD